MTTDEKQEGNSKRDDAVCCFDVCMNAIVCLCVCMCMSVQAGAFCSFYLYLCVSCEVARILRTYVGSYDMHAYHRI